MEDAVARDGVNRIVLARSGSKYHPAFVIAQLGGCLAARITSGILRWFAASVFGSIEALANRWQHGK
ncbi:hypothetical protein A5760_04055 [Mycobacterium colombiense]|uniref:Uncharacterized protein n=1 Tax=Mycobacterium colombiense TaxID=339268 RepID=A0A1A0VUT5_9MYCO|nr:hypothetical protein [Mycobacterium colombiense]OBB86992.1 hypothetical protein A5760_04055 [Mycobacterium colombiense]